ncbi:MAG: thiamine biosynthesis protein [Spirochaetes bacterium]|nr:thiamine biosynthesis protein [Spirochaetota bacterium]
MSSRCLVLCSGGLDSLLACAILTREKIDVTALHFEMGLGVSALARRFGIDASPHPVEQRVKSVGATFRAEPLRSDYLKVLLHPKHGYGSAANPCIDCHAYMFRTAKGIMEREGYDFIATGEVLGQRPMSQRRDALDIVAEEATLDNQIVRPLSAKLLPPTEAEKRGLFDREHLYDIEGRSRHRQMEMAKDFGLNDYPTPAGGCILTDDAFADKLREYRANTPEGDMTLEDLSLLSFGRHFRIDNNAKLILGRNALENGLLEHFKTGRIMIVPDYRKGPQGLLILPLNKAVDSEQCIRASASIIAFFSKEPVTVFPMKVLDASGERAVTVSADERDRAAAYKSINN